ncbi:MAG: S9 family peptidase [Bacteroidales bacterium]|nr:S9 family peptidase [Bacteroidales bacterium]
MKKINLLLSLLLVLPFSLFAQVNLKYQTPPKEILELANSKLTPSVSIDKEGKWMLLMGRSAYKSIEQVAAKEYRLGGLRINPKNNDNSRVRYIETLTLKNIASSEEFNIKGMPKNAQIANISWSPDYSKIAFTNTLAKTIELWVVDVNTKTAKKLSQDLNGVFGRGSYNWFADGQSLLCLFINPDRGIMPNENKTPTGPVIQENMGKRAPSRTYQDLLKNGTDEALFDYFATSILVKVTLNGNKKTLTKAEIFSSFNLSPNGEYILARTIQKPYSYLVPYYRFPAKLELLNKDGEFIKIVQELPLIEEMPQGFDAAQSGARRVSWRADKPASLYWVEALDGGDPKNKVELRDAVYTTDYPFDLNIKNHLVSTKNRFAGVSWGNNNIAIVYDRWRKNRNSVTYLINPSVSNKNPTILYDRSTEDLYSDPGYFVTDENEFGRNTLLITNKKYLYLVGQGYSPEGNRPFIDRFDLNKKNSIRLWQADGKKTYENITEVLDIQRGLLITNVQSEDQNPQYFIRNIKKKIAPKQITNFPNPYKSLTGVSKEFIKYKREDGVDLSATLYLPAGYNKEKDGPLPLLMWAYPREYKDSKTAGMIRTSPHRFMRVNYRSPIFWVNRGFAVMENTEFPIIGVGSEEPNDNFVPQLIANAKAAIDYVVKLGVVDPDRCAVGGHSYGAFMTANLLTHSDLFAAGIARSGAYNRTLTPFGFQSEERTYWQAPELYYAMSPFMHADIMKHPLLLIHGIADNNSGTFPLQSERYYNALKGHGATVRLVMLPAEMHGYAAKESIFHVLWETDQWLMKYVKNKK